jgi:hypothetical protein
MRRRNPVYRDLMTSQRFLKLLSLISLIATMTAIAIWRQTGEAPSPWLTRLAVAALCAALVVFVIDRETRPRIMLQFLAALFATLALFTFAADYTGAHSATGGFHSMTLLERMTDFAPSLPVSIKNGVSRALGVAAWDSGIALLFGLPAYLFFAILALVSGYAGRPRREIQIYIN